MLSISQFAKQVALSPDTLRYYEKLGLLQPQRNAQHQRQYSQQDQDWLAFIQRLKQIGMSMHDIQTYAQLRAQGDRTITARMALVQAQSQQLLAKRIELDQQLAFLNQKMAFYQDQLATLASIDPQR